MSARPGAGDAAAEATSAAAEASQPLVLDLGQAGHIRCRVAVCDQPWARLGLDCLIVSVGDQLGGLAYSLRQASPDPAWESIDFSSVRSGSARALSLERAPADGNTVQTVVMANPRPQPRADPTLQSCVAATVDAIEEAVRAGARSVGVPLLATGVLGLTQMAVAAAVTPAIIDLLSGLQESTLEALTIVVKSSVPDATQIQSLWQRRSTGPGPAPKSLVLHPAVDELLGLACGLARARKADAVGGADLLIAVLVRAGSTRLDANELRKGASHSLVAAIGDEPKATVDAVLRLWHVSETVIQPEPWRASPETTASVRAAGEDVARRVNRTELLSHHLLAAALSDRLEPKVMALIDVSQNQLRRALRAGIAQRWPHEPSQVWDEILSLSSYERQGIRTDLWTTSDNLGYSVYAEAIARGIQHSSTRAPLTIGIKAPWGAGKTSLMRMIQERLEWPSAPQPDAAPLKTRSIKLKAESRTLLSNTKVMPRSLAKASPAQSEGTARSPSQVTTRDVISALTDARAADTGRDSQHLEAELEVEDQERRWRPTVWFNPWMYQSGEQVWAGLAHEIIDQVTQRMSRLEREQFWLHLNRSRVDEQAVRRRVYSLILDRMIPWVIAAVVAGIVWAVAATRLDAAWVNWLLIIAPGLLGVGGIAARQQVLAKPAAASLDQIVSTRDTTRGIAQTIVKNGYSDLVETADYQSKAGFFYLMHRDIVRVLQLVATEKRPLVILIDDLDRCGPDTVVQVIEAINLFLAGQLPNCIFVIAMDPEVVAAHIEIAYSTLAERLASQSGDAATADFRLGWRFLEKIIQLPLTLPEMDEPNLDTFYTSLFDPETTDADAGMDPPVEEKPAGPASSGVDGAAARSAAEGRPAEAEIAKAQRQIGSAPDAALGSTAALLGLGEAGREAARRAVEERLTSGSPDVRKAIGLGMKSLTANPREIKRFVNLFKFLVVINNERGLRGLPTADSLNCLAKIAVLVQRWPALMARLSDYGPTHTRDCLKLIEQHHADGDSAAGSLDTQLASQGLDPALCKALVEPELVAVLQERPRISGSCLGLL